MQSDTEPAKEAAPPTPKRRPGWHYAAIGVGVIVVIVVGFVAVSLLYYHESPWHLARHLVLHL